MNLEELGYDDWFRVRLGENLARETNIARVMAVERDRYLIGAAFGCIPAEITGRLRYGAVAAEDLPCVGDWVLADYLDNGQHAILCTTRCREERSYGEDHPGQESNTSLSPQISMSHYRLPAALGPHRGFPAQPRFAQALSAEAQLAAVARLAKAKEV